MKRYNQEPFRVLLINVREQKNEVARLMKKAGVDLPVIFDLEGAVSRDYRVSAHPFKFLIDRQGDVIAMGLGYRNWDSEEMDRLVNVLIRATGEPPGS